MATLVGHQQTAFASGNQIAITYTPQKAGNLLIAYLAVEYYTGHIPTTFTPVVLTDASGAIWTQDAAVDTQALNNSYQSGTVAWHTTSQGASILNLSFRLNTADLTGVISISILEFSGVSTTNVPALSTTYRTGSATADTTQTQTLPQGYLVVQGLNFPFTNGNAMNAVGNMLFVDTIQGQIGINIPGNNTAYMISAGGAQTFGMTSNVNGQANSAITLVFPAPQTPSIPSVVPNTSISFPSVDPSSQSAPGAGGARVDCGTHLGRATFDFSLNTTYHFDLLQLSNVSKLRGIKTLYIDASNQINPVTITSNDTQQVIIALPRTQGYYAFYSGSGKMTLFCSAGNTGFPLPVTMFDTAVSTLVWAASPSGVTALATVTANAGSGTMLIAPQAISTGGALPLHYLAVAGANQDSTVVKPAPGTLYSLHLFNAAAAVRYVKIYDKATAPSFADVPVQSIGLPAGGSVAVALPAVGLLCFFGVAFRMTNLQADADQTAVTPGDIALSLTYK